MESREKGLKSRRDAEAQRRLAWALPVSSPHTFASSCELALRLFSLGVPCASARNPPNSIPSSASSLFVCFVCLVVRKPHGFPAMGHTGNAARRRFNPTKTSVFASTPDRSRVSSGSLW